MYRIALIVGLLVTPAAAETYTPFECTLIMELLDNCTVAPQSRAFQTRAELSRQMADKHPERDGNECDKVCAGKITVRGALHKYCPPHRSTSIITPSPQKPRRVECAR
jgi:hypothetical protein